jgi:hypothetical protein
MDFVVARIPELYGVIGFDNAPEEVRAALTDAHVPFGRLLEVTARTKGLTIGGYQTADVSTHKDLQRRGGSSAKDLLEAEFRCYASGAIQYDDFQKLLDEIPDLRVRSEIIGMHRECWNRIKERVKAAEPWESTIHLVVNALLEGCTVSQVDFQWLLEPRPKSDADMKLQLMRGIHSIERLLHSLGLIEARSPAGSSFEPCRAWK